ncbi:cytochrome c oxidase subunit 3 [Limnovirga soli]|uniref:Heme-copper oxidase subunit III n=1 Tax=Limnovirga soli TaxID=2656915 RepID=A0A8J8FJY5_9BACT|nr:cytochrome c oxidase subunit 3 [Limnovirga soli]NNV56424.1 heme-copper oxidase subunit III [Limnovirga soli]
MTTVSNNQRNRIHPHKFTMWVAMGSIVMMFAGLTSAYIVRSNQGNWLEFNLPVVFWYSTLVILCSSLFIHLSVKAFKAREMQRYRLLITITMALGLLFSVLQFVGFSDLKTHGVQLLGVGSNPAASFLAIICGLHILHVLGGVVVLMIIFLRAYSNKSKNYNPVPVEIVATYWHFVDILWIYLFIFFSIIHT